MVWKIRGIAKETSGALPGPAINGQTSCCQTRNSEGDDTCGASLSAGTMPSCCDELSFGESKNLAKDESSQSRFSGRKLSGNSENCSSSGQQGLCDQNRQSFSSGMSGKTIAEVPSSIFAKKSKRLDQRRFDLHPKMRKSVRFSVLEIRDYERILGDNPCCSAGPAIGIGWSHGETRVVKIPQLARRESRCLYRKKQHELILSRQEREELLYSWGVTSQEIASGVRMIIKAKSQRRQTINNLDKAFIEEGFQSATRKLKRVLLFRPRIGMEAKKLEEQYRLIAKETFLSTSQRPISVK